MMNSTEFIFFVLILTLATAVTRFLPFIIFRENQKTPEIIEYLGKVLPAAMMGLLVIYCFRDVDFNNINELIPYAAASTGVILIHLWKRNTLLSIALGTGIYMLLIRIIQ